MTGKLKIVLIYCISIAILVSVGAYAYQSANQYKNAADWVNHTQEVISEAQAILANIQSVESSQRGYVITGDIKYLKNYEIGFKNAELAYLNVLSLTKGNAGQQAILDSLKPIIKSKIEFVKQVVKERKENGYASAQKLIVTDLGENLMQEIRLVSNRFVTNERSFLSDRLISAKSNFSQTQNIIIASVLLTVVILFLALFLFIHDYNKRMQSEKKVVESEIRIKKFMESLPVGIYILNSNGKPFYANSKSKEILGKGIDPESSMEKMPQVYQAYLMGTNDLYSSNMQPIVRALKGERNVCVDDMEIEKQGVRIPLRINASNITDSEGNVEFAIAVFEDVSDIRETEKKLMEAKRMAEESNILKETFLANMSHEIRTPMNAILGFTDLLLKKNLGNQEKEYAKTIKTSGEALLRIINDILDVSKIESGIMTFEEHALSISEMFSSLNIMLSYGAKEKGLQLFFTCDSSIPDTLLGDPTRLTQILINLVGNAIKFTNKGKIEIFAKAIREENNLLYVEFSVTDSGIGITEDKLNLIFERFRQAESHTTRNYGGTGLGLSIAKQLVELQGGEIHVKSQLGIGTVFTFILPLKKTNEIFEANNKHEHVSEIGMEELSTKKILLVEDNPINIKFMISLFDEFKIKTDLAENGKIAVEKIKNKVYDLILMDIEMPEMNGYEATTIIRKELNSTVPIIAMTAHAMAGESEKCLSLGMNAYISKPVKEKLLFEKMISLSVNTNLENTTSKTNTKIVNLDFLIKSMRGKKEVIRDTIDIYLAQMPEDSLILNDAVEKMDYSLIKRYAHRIKSTVSLMGIVEMEKILEELEELSAQKEDDEKIRLLHSVFVQLEKRAIEEINIEKLKFI
jgi:PAS domain S-box-containing protein